MLVQERKDFQELFMGGEHLLPVLDALEDWLTNARARRSARAVFMPFLFTYILVNFVFSRK